MAELSRNGPRWAVGGREDDDSGLVPPEDEKWDNNGSDGRAPNPRMSRLDEKKVPAMLA